MKKPDTDFHQNKVQNKDSQFISLSVLLIDSLFRTGKDYYLQGLLEECKHLIK